jgi:hypothetical protein
MLPTTRVAPGMDMHVLHNDLLLALAPVLVERGELLGIELHQAGRMLQRHVTPRKGLVGHGGPAKTFERRDMRPHHLLGQHALGRIRRLEAFIELESAGDPDVLLLPVDTAVLFYRQFMEVVAVRSCEVPSIP